MLLSSNVVWGSTRNFDINVNEYIYMIFLIF